MNALCVCDQLSASVVSVVGVCGLVFCVYFYLSTCIYFDCFFLILKAVFGGCSDVVCATAKTSFDVYGDLLYIFLLADLTACTQY